MQTKTDAELLRDYAANRSEPAFGEIVRRYADFVYSAALRQVGNAEQARDVAQVVFADLARKAGSLHVNTLLIGWLCQGARLVALKQLRGDQRRAQRERQAMELLDTSSDAPNHWPGVRPLLDEALANLDHEDRDALLLRFFKNESLASVGASLGVSEDAAQKRVSRALDKLRDFLAGRGIKTTTAALSAVLTTNAVQSAPAGFAGALTAGALVNSTVAGSSTVPFLKLVSFSNMKTALLILALTGGLAGLTVLNVNARRELREAKTLAMEQTDELAALRATNDQFAAQAAELEQLRAATRDLARLRGEVARLRQGISQGPATAAAPPAESPASPPTMLLMTTRLVSLPRSALSALNQSGISLRSGGTAILTESQCKTLYEAFKDASDANTLGEPRIIAQNGEPTKVGIWQEVPLHGTNAPVGIGLHITPQYSGSVFDLNLMTQISHLVDSSPLQDGSQKSIETSDVGGQALLTEGQTAVLARDIPSEDWMGVDPTNPVAGPRTLLLFVTPSIAKAEPRIQVLNDWARGPVTRVIDTNSIEAAVKAHP